MNVSNVNEQLVMQVCYYTNMTSQWGYSDGMSPEGGSFSLGLRPRDIPSAEGDIPQGIPTGMTYLCYYTEKNGKISMKTTIR